MHLSAFRWFLRRGWFVAQLRLKARLKGATIDLRVAPDVRIGPGVRVSLDRGSRNVLHLGKGCFLQEDVLVLLRGGELRMGPSCQLRRGVVLNVDGSLVFEGRNLVTYYSTIHCAERIVFRDRATAAEMVTVADSRHFPDGDGEVFYDNTESAPVEIGENTWLAAKATVTLGVRIGANCIVAANAVVVRDVPDGAVVAGIPARIVRQR